MQNRVQDLAVASPAITAPAWAPVITEINAVLTTVSLVLGIAFLLWRWRAAAKRHAGGREGDWA